MLNRGKFNVGATNNISYGDQSPADDAVPLAWAVGDVRWYVSNVKDASKLIAKWVCIAAGTPGTWQCISYVRNWPILQVPLLFSGNYNHPGTEIYMAPATADWHQGDEINAHIGQFPLSGGNLGTPTLSGAAPTTVALVIWITQNDWDTTVPNGLEFRVFRDSGVLLGSGTVNADPATLGRFAPVVLNLAADVIDTSTALYCTMTSDPAAGTAVFKLAGTLSVWRNTLADYPS